MCAISRTYAYLTAYTLTYITENKLWNKCLYLTSSLFFVLFAPGDKISNIFLLSALSFYLPEQIPILLKKTETLSRNCIYFCGIFAKHWNSYLMLLSWTFSKPCFLSSACLWHLNWFVHCKMRVFANVKCGKRKLVKNYNRNKNKRKMLEKNEEVNTKYWEKDKTTIHNVNYKKAWKICVEILFFNIFHVRPL